MKAMEHEALYSLRFLTFTLISAVIGAFFLGIHLELHNIQGAQYRGILMFAMVALVSFQYMIDSWEKRHEYSQYLVLMVFLSSLTVMPHALLVGRDFKAAMFIHPFLSIVYLAFAFRYSRNLFHEKELIESTYENEGEEL